MAYIPRVYLPGAAAAQTRPLPTGTAHHLVRVLRLRRGAPVLIFDGEGGEYEGSLESTGREPRVHVGELRRTEPAPALAVTLVAALSRQTRMEWTLEKAVELGAAAIWPVFSDHAHIQLDQKRTARKIAHWEGLVVAAAAQCGRARLPALRAPAALETAVREARGDTRLLLDPQSRRGLSGLPAPGARLALMAGPESGFSERERAAAEAAGWTAVRLGPRILRAETAGPAALAAVQALWGDWR